MSMLNPVCDVVTFPILSCRNLVRRCENLSVQHHYYLKNLGPGLCFGFCHSKTCVSDTVNICSIHQKQKNELKKKCE